MKKLTLLLLLLVVPLLKFTPTQSAEISYTTYWEPVNVVGSVYSMSFAFDIDEGTNSMDITIVDLGYNYNTVSTYDSEIKLYDGAVLVFEANLDTIIEFDTTTFDFSGTINIDFDEWFIDGSYGDAFIDDEDMYTIDYIAVNVMQTFTSVPAGYEVSFEAVSPIMLDRTYNIIRYFALTDIGGGVTQTQLYHQQQVFTDFPETITDPPDLSTSNIFEYWVYRSSDDEWVKYDYTEPINDNMFTGTNNYVLMMAVFTDYADEYDTTIDDTLNAPTNLLNILGIAGMNNTAGYVILYALINLIIVIIVAVYKLKIIYGTIASSAIASLFILFNILPVYVVVITILLYILFFATYKEKRAGI